jgi:hypothetical protein
LLAAPNAFVLPGRRMGIFERMFRVAANPHLLAAVVGSRRACTPRASSSKSATRRPPSARRTSEQTQAGRRAALSLRGQFAPDGRQQFNRSVGSDAAK